MKTEGQILRDARIKSGYTQEQISRRLGFTSPQYISNCERDKCPLSPDLFKPIAKMLGERPLRDIIAMRSRNYRLELLSKLT